MDMMARRRAMLQTATEQSGSGAEVIAEGTYMGDGNCYATIRIGARCPETDFVFLVWLDPEHVLPVDSKYKLVQLSLLVSHEFVRFDLSSSGSKAPNAQMSFTDANGASRAPNIPVIVGAYVVSNSVGRAEYQGDKVRLIRYADGFAVSVNRSNASCPFLDGATFHWRLIYYGADPAHDIITI